MSDESSVNVPAGAATPETPTRPPYQLVLVSDLGTAGKLGTPAAIDKDNFAQVLADAGPKCVLSIGDVLGNGSDWEFELTFDNLRSFAPAAFLLQISGARWRLGIREKIVARRSGQCSPTELDEAIAAAIAGDASLKWLTASEPSTATSASAPSAASGSILDQVDDPDDAAKVSANVERLARDAGDPDARIAAGETKRLDTLLARIDRELDTIANAVLKHAQFRKLETAWRNVKFLVDRIDFRANVRLSILSAPRDTAVEAVIDQIIEPAFDGEVPTPGMILFDYACTNTPADIEQLDQLAQHAASLPVPVVVPFEPQFFDVKAWRLLKNLPNLSGLIDGWQFAKWRSLRDQPYARALVPAVGRFLLRSPHAPAKNSHEYQCRESAEKIGDLLWTHAHLALGVCAARSFANHGWPTRMFGAEAGKLEDLPVVDNPNDPQSPWGPGDLVLPDRRLDEVAQAGFNFLLAVKSSDHCMLLGGVSAARPKQTADTSANQAALEISLPYQQIASVISAHLSEQIPQLRGLPTDQVQQRLLFGFANLFGIKDASEMDAVQVGIGQHPDDASKTIVQLLIAPPQRIAPAGLHMDIAFEL